jgi:hypothetical protein
MRHSHFPIFMSVSWIIHLLAIADMNGMSHFIAKSRYTCGSSLLADQRENHGIFHIFSYVYLRVPRMNYGSLNHIIS